MRIVLIFFALLFLSCSKEVELAQKSGILFLKEVEAGLGNLENVPWKVGREREVEISKGLRFDADVPKMSKEAADTLWRKYGIDSWIYRISKINRGSRMHVGYVAVNSKSEKHIVKSFTVHLFYHAASISNQFRRFFCPAFGHRKTPVEFSVEKDSSIIPVNVYVRAADYVRGDVSRISFSQLIFSGGAKLEGKYVVEMGLYNSKEKRLYSPWIPLNGYIDVSLEGSKRVQSCVGVKEEINPLPGSRAPRIEDLQLR